MYSLPVAGVNDLDLVARGDRNRGAVVDNRDPVAAHPLIWAGADQGMRNRIAHNYWTVDDIVWIVVEQHSPQLRRDLADEVEEARSTLDAAGGPETGEA